MREYVARIMDPDAGRPDLDVLRAQCFQALITSEPAVMQCCIASGLLRLLEYLRCSG